MNPSISRVPAPTRGLGRSCTPSDGGLRARLLDRVHRSARHEVGEDVDEVGIELAPRVLSKLGERLVAAARVSIGALAGHGVESVDDRDDARRERDVVAGEAVGITGAVVALVMVSHGGGHRRREPERPQQPLAHRRMRLDRFEPLGLGQDLAGEHVARRADLADVVEEGGHANVVALLAGEAEPRGDEVCGEGDAAGVAAHEEIPGLDRLGEDLEEFEGARSTGARARGAALQSRLGEQCAQALLGQRVGLELVEREMRVPVGAEDPAHFLEERDRSPAALAAGECALDRGRHLHDVEGLDQIVEDAVADALDGGLDRAAAGDDDDLGLGRLGADRPHQLVALHAGHVQVDGDEIDLFGSEHVERFGSVFRGGHFVATGKNHAKRLAWPPFVVDDQDTGSPPSRSLRAAERGRSSGIEVEAHGPRVEQGLCRAGRAAKFAGHDPRKCLLYKRNRPMDQYANAIPRAVGDRGGAGVRWARGRP